MKKERLSAIFILFTVLIISCAYAVNYDQTSFNNSIEDTKFGIQSENSLRLSIASNLTDDDAIMGDPNAPVTMVEFGGFEETFSRLFWNNTFPTIKSQYIDTGKVKFVFRDFPLVELFPLDGYAAVAAECVHQQGKDDAYFQMWNALYATNQIFNEEVINQLAFDLGYNITECIKSQLTLDEVVLDVVDSLKLGIEGSPSFFIYSEFISGAQPISIFQTAIEKALNESIACFTNSQCNDANPYTFDTCQNAGKLNATCRHQSIQCLKNSDCGNSTTIKYCNAQGNACSTSTNYLCNNARTLQASCSSCIFGCNNQTFMCKPVPVITIFSPINNRIYNLTSLPFNLTTGNTFFNELSYIDWSETRPRWNILCKNCNEYGLKKKFTKSFDEGTHNLTFRGINGTIIISKNISFFIDSKDPKISTTLPKSKTFTNGSDFYVKYNEDNCKSLNLMIYSNIPASGGSFSCLSRKNIEKHVSANLNSYNNQEIEYQFIIKDIANNTDESKKTKIKIDTTKPIINSFANTTDGRRVTFILNITELNFDEVNYIDHNDAHLTVRTLCSSLRNGICTSTKTFHIGNHNIIIKVLDEAGNSVQRVIRFNI